MRTALTGIVLTAFVSAIALIAWGSRAVLPCAMFGLVASAIQVAAGTMMRTGGVPAAFTVFAARWAVGMGLRVAGIVLVVVALTLGRTVFAPLPTTVGFLGVLIPLLFLDARSLR
jgi:hypothetical protein